MIMFHKSVKQLFLLSIIFISACSTNTVKQIDAEEIPTEEISLKALDSQEPLDGYIAKVMEYKDEQLINQLSELANAIKLDEEFSFVSKDKEVIFLYATLLEIEYRGLKVSDEFYKPLKTVMIREACSPWLRGPILINSPDIKQFGTSQSDSANEVFIDKSDMSYIVGNTEGHFVARNAGGTDAFVCKYNSTGNTIWAKQFGSANYDSANSVAVDGSGNVYVVGKVDGAITSPVPGGFGVDAFVRKYDANGNQIWTRQFGLARNNYDAVGIAITPDDSFFYVVGTYTPVSHSSNFVGYSDAFIRKYTSGGQGIWEKKVVTPLIDYIHAVSVDGSGDAYIAGVAGELQNLRLTCPSAFVRKYDTAGNIDWTDQYTTSQNQCGSAFANDIAFYNNSIFIAGSTNGNLSEQNLGIYDAYLRKYQASSGRVEWTRQFGTARKDTATGVAVSSGIVYVTGWTEGDLATTNLGKEDVFLSEFTTHGHTLAHTQYGTADRDNAISIALSSSHKAIIAGFTWDFTNSSQTFNSNAFLIRVP